MRRKIWVSTFLAVVLMIPTLLSPFDSEGLRYSQYTDLSEADASLWKLDGGYNMGHSSSICGDVNGDGYDDLIMGGYSSTKDLSVQGSVCLIFGGEKQWKSDMDLDNISIRFWGENEGSYLGIHATGAGDVNGDGFDDILFAAKFDSEYGQGMGQVYLMFGKPDGWVSEMNVSEADVSFYSGGEDGRAGFCIAGGGDVDGDGIDDILISAEAGSYYDPGRTYLIYGKKEGWKRETCLNESSSSFIASTYRTGFGSGLSNNGDLNGDGIDDILIAALNPGSDEYYKGEIHIFFGKTGRFQRNTSTTLADGSLIGEYTGDGCNQVSFCGDVNDDGYDDFLVGAYQNDDSAEDSGKIYLIIGKKFGWGLDRSLLSSSRATFVGENENDRFGYFSDWPGDVNGDGLCDILMGASFQEAGGVEAGRAYLFLGKKNGWTMGTPATNADLIFTGESYRSFAGEFVSIGGDMNGDGMDDVVVAARLYREIGYSGGKTYVIFPEINIGPSSINNFTIFEEDLTTLKNSTFMGDTVTLEINGTDSDPDVANVARVKIFTEGPIRFGIDLRLRETGKNTGIYQGEFHVRNRTHERYGWIGVEDGDQINILSLDVPSVQRTLTVDSSFEISPVPDNITLNEDEEFEISFGIPERMGVTWTCQGLRSWLHFDEENVMIYGTPRDQDVGEYHLKLFASQGNGYFDDIDFNITVKNIPHILMDDALPSAIEDEFYIHTLNSSAYDSEDIFWYHSTSVNWMKLDDKGRISGIPENEDVGIHWVNITLMDGNMMTSSKNFTITVIGTNDRPVSVESVDPIILLEDQILSGYDINSLFNDPDGDGLTFSFSEGKEITLNISSNGNLSIEPYPDWHGSEIITITASDGEFSNSIQIMVIVQAVNDPPRLRTAGEKKTTIFEDFNDYPIDPSNSFEDVDGDMVEISVTSSPEILVDHEPGGFIYISPMKDWTGMGWLAINFSDGEGWVIENSSIIVIPVNDPPVVQDPSFEIISSINKTVDVSAYNVSDVDGDLIEYFWDMGDGTGLTGRSITHTYPEDENERTYTITLSITDGHVWSNQSMGIIIPAYVSPDVNMTKPEAPPESENETVEKVVKEDITPVQIILIIIFLIFLILAIVAFLIVSRRSRAIYTEPDDEPLKEEETPTSTDDQIPPPI